MDHNTEIQTVNTGIDTSEKGCDFAFDDILDGIFSIKK